MRYLYLSLLLACDGQNLALPPDPKSLDYAFEPIDGKNGFDQIHSYVDSTVFELRIGRTAVPNVEVHYRATLGFIRPKVDTTDGRGRTHFVWGVGEDQQQGLGEVFGCAVGSDGCVDQRFTGVDFH